MKETFEQFASRRIKEMVGGMNNRPTQFENEQKNLAPQQTTPVQPIQNTAVTQPTQTPDYKTEIATAESKWKEAESAFDTAYNNKEDTEPYRVAADNAKAEYDGAVARSTESERLGYRSLDEIEKALEDAKTAQAQAEKIYSDLWDKDHYGDYDTELKNANDAAALVKSLEDEYKTTKEALRLSPETGRYYEGIVKDLGAAVFNNTATPEQIEQYNNAQWFLNNDSDTAGERIAHSVGGATLGATAGVANTVATGANAVSNVIGLKENEKTPEYKELEAKADDAYEAYQTAQNEHTLGNVSDEELATLKTTYLEARDARDRLAESIITDREGWIKNISDFGDKVSEEQMKMIEKAKQNASTFEQFAVDVIKSGTEMSIDALASVLGINSLAVMAIRVFGDSAREARYQGASLEEQIFYGLASAGTEVFTEKMFDGLAGIYGTSEADEIVKEVINKLANDPTEIFLLNTLYGAGGEAAEELVSGILAPISEQIINNEAIKESYFTPKGRAKLADDIVNAMLSASVLGGFGGSITGINSAKEWANTEQGKAVLDQAKQNGIDPQTIVDAVQENIDEVQQKQTNQELADITESVVNPNPTSNDGNVKPTMEQRNTQFEEQKTATPTETVAEVANDVLTPKQTQPDSGEKLTPYEQAINDAVARITETEPKEQKATQPSDAHDNGEKLNQFDKTDTTSAVKTESIQKTTNNGDIKPTEKERATVYEESENKGSTETLENTDESVPPTTEEIVTEKTDELNSATNDKANSAEAKKLKKGIEAIKKGIRQNEDLLKTPGASSSVRTQIEQELATQRKNLAKREAEYEALVSNNEVTKSATETMETPTTEAEPQTTTEVEAQEETSDVVTDAEETEQNSEAETNETVAEDVVEVETKVDEESVKEDLTDLENDIVDIVEELQDDTISEERRAKLEDKLEAKQERHDTKANTLTEYKPSNTYTNAITKYNSFSTKSDTNTSSYTDPVNMKESKTESNTLQNSAETLGGTQDKLYYIPVSEKQTLNEAMNRVATDMIGEMNRLADSQNGAWTAADVDTAMTINGKLMLDGIRTGDRTAQQTWSKLVQSRMTNTAQSLQALAKWSRTGTAVADEAITEIGNLVAEGKMSSEEGARIVDEISKIAEEYDAIGENDIDSIRQLILRMNKERGTGTFVKSKFKKLLGEETNMEYLKEFALKQMMSMVSDYTDTSSLGQKIKTWQVNAQLTRLGTFFRNIGGNLAFGAQDTLAQNAFGVAIDRLISHYTGKRTVGIDKGWFSSEARAAAVKSKNRSILEVAADVDMGSDSKYGNSSSRTYKMSGNKFSKFMSRWEQLLGYSLTTSDRTSRGQIEQSVTEALNAETSGLTEDEIARIGERAADYRLFQNKDTAYKISKGIHDVFNVIGIGGEVNGVTRNGGFGVGDLVNAYPGVPANLAVKALEYSPANVVKGGIELVKVLKEAKNGTLDAVKQYDAVMSIARGMTGTPIIALLTVLAKSGAFKNFDDEDDYDVLAQNAAEGKTGVQWNLDATMRMLTGKDGGWKDGDTLISIGWLEPMNAFLAMASLMATEEDGSFMDYANDYLMGSIQSVLDMPVMQNISNITNKLKYADSLTPELMGEAAMEFAGDTLGGMIPAPISQLAKATDPYYRDTSADTELGTVTNRLMSNIPGLRQTLDAKQTGYGDDKEYAYTDAERWLNTFVLPGTVSQIQQSELSSEINKLVEATGNKNIVPDRNADNKINYNNNTYELTTEEKKQYIETSGELISAMYEDAMSTDAWEYMSDTDKVETLIKIKSYAEDVAKQGVIEGRGDEYFGTSLFETDDVVDMLIGKTIASNANLGYEKDKQGNLIEQDYEAIDNLVDIYNNMSEADQNRFETSYGRIDEVAEAAAAGISSETFFNLYGKYKEIDSSEGKTSVQQATEWAAYIDNRTDLNDYQKQTMKDLLKMRSTMVSETKKYDALTADGLNPTTASNLYMDLSKLQPIGDAKSVTSLQYVQAITARSDLSNKEMLIAINNYGSDKQKLLYYMADKNNMKFKDMTNFLGFLNFVSGKLSKSGSVSMKSLYIALQAVQDEKMRELIWAAYYPPTDSSGNATNKTQYRNFKLS